VNKGLNDRIDPTYVLFDGVPPRMKAKASSKPSTSGSSDTSSAGNVAAAKATPVNTGVTTGSSTGSTGTTTSTPSASDTQAALLAALKGLASGGLGTPKPTGTTGTPVLKGAANMNQTKPAVIANVNQAQANRTVQAKPAKSKNVFQSFADKIGISKFI
jgi:hypothetical protein